MTTPEGKVKDILRKEMKRLEKDGCYYTMPVPTGMGGPTVDFYICYKGVFVAVEAKAKATDKPTPRQAKVLRDVKRAGGLSFTVAGEEAAKKFFSILDTILKGHVADYEDTITGDALNATTS